MEYLILTVWGFIDSLYPLLMKWVFVWFTVDKRWEADIMESKLMEEDGKSGKNQGVFKT